MLWLDALGAVQAAAVAGLLAAARDGDAAAAVERAARLWPDFDWDALIDVWTETEGEATGRSEERAIIATATRVRRRVYGDDIGEYYTAWADVPIRPAETDDPDDVTAVGAVADRYGLTDVKMSRRGDLDGTHWVIWVTTADGRRLSVSTASTLGGLGVAERVDDDPAAVTAMGVTGPDLEPIWEAAEAWRSPAAALDIGLTVAESLQNVNRPLTAEQVDDALGWMLDALDADGGGPHP